MNTHTQNTQLNSKFKFSSEIFFVILLVPLFSISLIISDNFIDTFVTPKESFLLMYLTIYVLIFSVYLLFRNKSINIQFNKTDLFILLIFIYCILRILFSDNSVFNNTYFIKISALFVLYFIIKVLLNFQNSDYSLKIILIGLLFFYLIQILWGYLQLWDFIDPAMLNFKIGGGFGNPGPFSNYIVSILPVALGLHFLKNEESKFDRFLSKLGFWIVILILILLPATKARTSWIAAFIGIILIIWTHQPYKNKILHVLRFYYRKIILLVFSAIILILIATYLFDYKQDSANGRLFTWKLTKEIFIDNPIIGSGFDSFLVTHNNYQANFFAKKGGLVPEAKLADNISFAFNEFFQISAELGIIGLLLFLSIFISIFLKSNIRNNEKSITYFKISILVILISALFSYPFHDTSLLITICVFLAIVSSNSNTYIKSISFNPKIIKVLTLVSIACCIYFINAQYTQYTYHKKWKAASVELTQNPNSINKYDKMYPVLRNNGYFLYNYGAELSLRNNHTKAIEILTETLPFLNDADVYIYLGNSYEGIGDLRKAEECFLKSWNLIPHKLYPQYRLVYIYAKIGRMEKALEFAYQIINADVKVESQTTNDIKTEMTNFVNNNLIQ